MSRPPQNDPNSIPSDVSSKKSLYVHGYTAGENDRLNDQASTLSELFHHDTRFPEGSRVLEAGCGVGAQTVLLAEANPGTQFFSIDLSAESVEEARQRVDSAGLTNVTFQQADIFAPPFEKNSFDHLFVCFVLEHLPQPVEALASLIGFLKPGGSITMIEGDHGSTFFHPESEAAHQAISSLVELQALSGGDANIGRKLYPILTQAGFESVSVSPRFVYVDDSRPNLVDGFTRKTFAAMIEGVREKVLQNRLLEAEIFDQGVADLYRAAEGGGVFCYTFFKAWGFKPTP